MIRYTRELKVGTKQRVLPTVAEVKAVILVMCGVFILERRAIGVSRLPSAADPRPLVRETLVPTCEKAAVILHH